MSTNGGAIRVIVFALATNLGITTAKLIGALVSGSVSMLAEAIHSLVDTSNQVLLLIGSKKSLRPPSDTHPLGYGREAFFWSFIVAILLFSLGGLFAIYEGAHKLSSHEEMSSPLVGVVILGISLVLEGFSFRACVKEIKSQMISDDNLWGWFRKTTAVDLLVVFTEDAAALVGLSIATFCLITSWITENPVWDAIGSILVGIVLVVVAVLLAIEIKSLIIGEAPATDFKSFLEKEIAHHIPGGKLLRLIAVQVGIKEVMISFKISPGHVHDVHQLITRINSIETATKKEFPQVKWQFVEPDFET